MLENDDPLPSLESLQRKINEAKTLAKAGERATSPDGNSRGYGRASQLAGEFIAGAGVGSVCGYFIDRWLGTSPLFLLLFFVLGFAVGVYGLMRSAKDADKNE